MHPTDFKEFTFSFSWKYFLISFEISLTPVLFRNILFNLHIVLDFPFILLLLTSNWILLWSESRHCMISILLALWRCVFWSRMWSVLVDVPCDLEKNMYSNVVEVFYRYQLYLVDWWCYWIQLYVLTDFLPSKFTHFWESGLFGF